MEVSMPNLLVALWLKSALNGVVLAVQKDHVTQSLVGVFTVGVSLLDTSLSSALTLLFLVRDVQWSELRLTRYHVCVLTRAACGVYERLQWPVLMLAALDSCCRGRWRRPVPYALVVLSALVLAMLHVFLSPDPEEGDHVTPAQCHLTGTSQSRRVLCVVLVLVAGMVCFSLSPTPERAEALRENMLKFLSTWRSFLVLLVLVLVSRTPVPPYLEMNAVWLAFLHSLFRPVAHDSCGCVLHGGPGTPQNTEHCAPSTGLVLNRVLNRVLDSRSEPELV